MGVIEQKKHAQQKLKLDLNWTQQRQGDHECKVTPWELQAIEKFNHFQFIVSGQIALLQAGSSGDTADVWILPTFPMELHRGDGRRFHFCLICRSVFPQRMVLPCKPVFLGQHSCSQDVQTYFLLAVSNSASLHTLLCISKVTTLYCVMLTVNRKQRRKFDAW